MRHICYEYQDQGPHGAIIAERYSLNASTNGPRVSRINPPAPSPISTDPDFDTTYTEYRGDSPTRTFNYTDLHLHRSFSEPDPCPTFRGPAPQQFLLSYTDFQAHTTQLGYDANWYVNSVTDANTHTTGYTRGPPPNAYPGPKGIGQILRITHPDTTHIDYTYYDESPNISGHYLQQITNERGAITYHTRDTNHRITRTDYPDGAYETFTYNNFGQVLTHRLRNGAVERFAHDTRGLLTDKWNPKQNAIPADTDPHTHYTYYASGPWTDRVLTMTLPRNVSGYVASETYEYNRNSSGAAVAGRGLVTKITHADNTYQASSYDAYGNKLWEENELRQRTSYIYDNYNRVLTVTNPLSQATTYTYNPTNGTGTSPYLHTTNNPDTVTTPTNIRTTNDYDQNFRKISVTQASGTALAATTTFGYDNVGNPTRVTDPLNHTTTTTFDSRNRKRMVTNALNQTTTFTYDAASNVTRIDHPDTTWETKTYDALNRVLADTVPQTSTVNLTTWLTYNPSGTIASVRDPNGNTTTFTYDASDQKIEMTYPGGTQSQSWTYDDAHNLKSRTTVGGKTQSFGYDNRNRMVRMTWSNSVEWRYFGYDAASRLARALNGTGAWNTNVISDVTRSYDAAGRLTQEAQQVTGLAVPKYINYYYNADGTQRRLYASDGYDYTFSYDAMGRFEKIFVTNGAQLFQYHYDAASNEVQRDNVYSGVNQIYPRDNLNRIMYVTLSNTSLVREDYGYDAMSRLTSLDRWNNQHDSFTYYLDGELNTARYYIANRSVNYALDKAGNRTSVTDNVNGNATYTLNVLNQYTGVTGSTISNGPEHEISAYRNVSYTYINDERLTRASDDTITYDFAYDALGRCVKRTLSGVTTYYVYDGEKPILEYNSAGHLVGWNLYGKGIDEIIERVTYASSNAWVAYFPQQDHEGSVIAITDANGAILEYYRYDAFGAPSIYGGPPNWTQRSATAYNNRFLFTGREYAATYQNTYIPAFGFYEYRARAYNPGLGRFMSEDPKLFDAGDYNLFRYCHNDPIDFTDPMGVLPNMPYHWTPELMGAMDRLWAMTQWFDRSNIMQGNFAGFASQSDRDAKGGFVMGQISRTEARMYSYALRPGYSIGDLAGARGYQYVSDPDPNCTGQCLTGVQHLTGTPSSRTPLVAGEAVGPNTRQGTAIAKGWVPQNGRYIYPSRPAGVSNNHAAIFVAQIGSRHMQILSQYNISPMQRAPLHFEVVPTSGWNVITSGLPARSASTSELRAWDGSVPW